MSTPGDWPQMYLACMSYVRQYQCLAAAAQFVGLAVYLGMWQVNRRTSKVNPLAAPVLLAWCRHPFGPC
jgi:hypothetical protein